MNTVLHGTDEQQYELLDMFERGGYSHVFNCRPVNNPQQECVAKIGLEADLRDELEIMIKYSQCPQVPRYVNSGKIIHVSMQMR